MPGSSRTSFAATGSDLGFITSAFVYESVVTRSAGRLAPDRYQGVRIAVKDSEVITGWMHLSAST